MYCSINLGKTDSDLTGCGVYLMIIGLVLLVFGIVTIFWRDPIVQLIYACLGALVFAVYLVFDTQLILGKKTYGYSLDDSYMAAIQLYMDIIQLFLNLLQIIGYFDR
jgi:FtsH-binding integral membrane protein